LIALRSARVDLGLPTSSALAEKRDDVCVQPNGGRDLGRRGFGPTALDLDGIDLRRPRGRKEIRRVVGISETGRRGAFVLWHWLSSTK